MSNIKFRKKVEDDTDIEEILFLDEYLNCHQNNPVYYGLNEFILNTFYFTTTMKLPKYLEIISQ